MLHFIQLYAKLLLLFVLVGSCIHKPEALPVLGKPEISGKDTIYPTINDFTFTNQDNHKISLKDLDGKIYIADFIFLSCPSICPKMTKEIHKVYDAYEQNPNIRFVSYTIDPEHDTVERLKAYSNKLGVDSEKWFFLTGNKDSIYDLAENSYFSIAYADKKAPGGFVHSAGVLLIDKNKHIRGIYDVSQQKESDRLMNDVVILLKE